MKERKRKVKIRKIQIEVDLESQSEENLIEINEESSINEIQNLTIQKLNLQLSMENYQEAKLEAEDYPKLTLLNV